MGGVYILADGNPASPIVIEECLVVEFQVVGDRCPLAAASRETGTAIDAHPPQRRADGTVLLHFSAPQDDSLASVLDADDRIRYLHAASADSRTNYRCLATAPCIAGRLTDAGLLAESLRYREGVERHTGAVVGYDVLRNVLEAAGEHNVGDGGAVDPTDPTARRVHESDASGGSDTPQKADMPQGTDTSQGADAHRETDVHQEADISRETEANRIGITVERVYPLGTDGDDSPVAKRFDLTAAQEAAIETAFGMGYFAVPRECTASEVADALGIGKSAFFERLRRGQARLFAGLFP